ncbi:glycosyltransferase [Dysgonomonas massiliensis]|uniref:glycosyltransferase n=1 Tax=Dysgonomonas massiliensis TaxID=2040292 RepID=UPI000C75CAE8|nr:glycosyltransferase [Dysgonomonas massiliensis]
MIFVTIGTQEPFDRLVEAMDEITKGIDEVVVVQTPTTRLQINNMEVVDFLSPHEYDKILNDARLIVSHAGMGTIISALMLNKPIIIMPRKASLGEHRNEHQLATSKKMKELQYTYVADDENELKLLLPQLLKDDIIKPAHTPIGRYASNGLISSLSEFIKK